MCPRWKQTTLNLETDPYGVKQSLTEHGNGARSMSMLCRDSCRNDVRDLV
jgi:hypothetical protein